MSDYVYEKILAETDQKAYWNDSSWERRKSMREALDRLLDIEFESRKVKVKKKV